MKEYEIIYASPAGKMGLVIQTVRKQAMVRKAVAEAVAQHMPHSIRVVLRTGRTIVDVSDQFVPEAYRPRHGL